METEPHSNVPTWVVAKQYPMPILNPCQWYWYMNLGKEQMQGQHWSIFFNSRAYRIPSWIHPPHTHTCTHILQALCQCTCEYQKCSRNIFVCIKCFWGSGCGKGNPTNQSGMWLEHRFGAILPALAAHISDSAPTCSWSTFSPHTLDRSQIEAPSAVYCSPAHTSQQAHLFPWICVQITPNFYSQGGLSHSRERGGRGEVGGEGKEGKDKAGSS